MKTIIYLVVFSFLYSCGSADEPNPAEEKVAINSTVTLTNAQYKSANISSHKLETKSISGIVKLNGKIDVPPQNLISVSVPLGGYLKSTKLLPGMRLSKGEVIAVLEEHSLDMTMAQKLLTQPVLEKLKQEGQELNILRKSKNVLPFS